MSVFIAVLVFMLCGSAHGDGSRKMLAYLGRTAKVIRSAELDGARLLHQELRVDQEPQLFIHEQSVHEVEPIIATVDLVDWEIRRTSIEEMEASSAEAESWNVVLSVICPGRLTRAEMAALLLTIHTRIGASVRLDTGLQLMGFPLNAATRELGDSITLAGFHFTASYSMNFPDSESADIALTVFRDITAQGLTEASCVKVESIMLSLIRL